jgi:16S rRNA (adenine1518-N6/adenine1519-N6)-dimethyltransferase
MFSVKEIKSLLKEYNIRPSKRLGQNFLIKKESVDKLLGAAEVSKEDNILEIGPGLGALTFELARKAKKVIAIEKDKRLVEILREMNGFSNLKVFQGDVLKVDLKLKDYKVVSNLPYCISSHLIRNLLEKEKKPKLITLMIQKELAQRIKAKPPFMNLLALSTQIYADIETEGKISKKSFWPEPKVDSSIINIKPNNNYLKKIKDLDLFFKIIKAGFSHPRKKVLNNLSEVIELKKESIKEILEKNSINKESRAQELEIGKWINLCNSFYKKVL